MAAYTFSCFSIFTRNYEDEEKRVLIRQNVLMFLLQFTAFGAMYLATDDIRIMFIYAALAVTLLAVILLYNLIYPNVSRLVVNNMCMLISAGMIVRQWISIWKCGAPDDLRHPWYRLRTDGADPDTEA